MWLGPRVACGVRSRKRLSRFFNFCSAAAAAAESIRQATRVALDGPQTKPLSSPLLLLFLRLAGCDDEASRRLSANELKAAQVARRT